MDGQDRQDLKFILFILSILLAFASIRLVQPPAAVPDSAPPEQFSSARAMRHLRELARAPHPTGSAENARVREYVTGELAALGVRAETQVALSVWESGRRERPSQAATVTNLVARLPGADPARPALMLAAHYDSVPTGPGASDDGAGVAAILETVRALKAGPPLRNDLVLLFTDGEELGLLGARAFAEGHPWMDDVAVVLNFEGRGRGGPSLMFETSEGNRALVSELAAADAYPVANSLMYALYKRLPNDTDMTVFKAAGASGLNFAYVSDITHYHTALDTPERADERSIQHHGAQALALARHFGRLDLARPSDDAGDAVYFNAVGPLVVRYPEWLALPLAALAAVALVVVFIYGLRRGRLRLKSIALGFLLTTVCVVAGACVALLVRWVVDGLHPDLRAVPFGAPYEAGAYGLAAVLLVVAASCGLYVLAGRRAGAAGLAAGASLWWLLALLLSAALLPGGSFLFMWPLAFALAGLSCEVFAREEVRATLKWAVVAAVCAAPAVLLSAPVAYMLFMLLGVAQPAPSAALVGLASALVVPLLRLHEWRRAWLLPGLTAAAGVALLVWGLAGARFDPDRPRADNVFYFADADTGAARWVSADPAPDEWTAQFFGADARRDVAASIFPWDAGTVLTNDAPMLDAPAPAAQIVEDATDGWLRRVRLRLTTRRGAPLMLVYTGPETEVHGAQLGGRRLSAEGQLRFFYAAVPAEGLDLRLEANASRPLRLTLVDATYGLPETLVTRPRPPAFMPGPSRLGDATLLRKSFTF